MRDFLDIPILKNVRPEDIEDVSGRYVPLFTSEREADTVKKVKEKFNLSDESVDEYFAQYWK